METTMTEIQDHPSTVIMKELSDIKTNLAVNTNETQNIKSTMAKVEASVNQIQSDFVSRREFNDRMTNVEDQISPMKKIMYGLMGTIGLAVLGAVLKLVIIK